MGFLVRPIDVYALMGVIAFLLAAIFRVVDLVLHGTRGDYYNPWWLAISLGVFFIFFSMGAATTFNEEGFLILSEFSGALFFIGFLALGFFSVEIFVQMRARSYAQRRETLLSYVTPFLTTTDRLPTDFSKLSEIEQVALFLNVAKDFPDKSPVELNLLLEEAQRLWPGVFAYM